MIHGHKISYSHKDYHILKGVDFSVEYGDVLAIVGPNGAGKSTLLNILANEISKNKEDIYFKLKKYKDWGILDLSKNKSKFSQHYSSDIPLPVRDVVLMGRYPYFDSLPKPEDLAAVEKSMGDTEVLHLKDRDYNSLSGGEKQRVHLARVMAQLDNGIAHKLVFLDEPLNNLDVKHQHQVLDLVQNFVKGGNTVVMVLHDLNLAAKYASKIILMHKGKIVSQGNPEEVFEDKTLTDTYSYPCTVCRNPLNNRPMIVFGD